MANTPFLLGESIVLLAFLAGSAFFSLSETAMIGVDRNKVRQLAQAGSARAQRVDKMLDEPERILSTVLIGNNLVNIGATAFATVIAVGLLGGKGAIVATAVMAVLIILVSELLPKTLAVQNPLPVALAIAGPLAFVELLLLPFVLGAAWISRKAAAAFGIETTSKAPYITADEIEMLVRMGVEQGEVEKFEQRVITELFQFTATDVHKVMTPADKVHWLPREATLAAAAELAAKEGRTRILVADGDFERVLGCVHVRDLLRYSDLQLDRTPVTQALRGVLVAPADLSADRLLIRMQKEHRLLAVIQDAQGHNIGICTVEDLLEELVGEIHDEFDAARGDHRHELKDGHAHPHEGPSTTRPLGP